MTYLTIIGAGYLLNLCDPVFSVWYEVCGVRVLSGRYDQDTDVGEQSLVNQAGLQPDLRKKSHSSSIENSCTSPSASSTMRAHR